MALTDDLLKQTRLTPAAIMGSKGSATSSRLGTEHYRRMAAGITDHVWTIAELILQ